MTIRPYWTNSIDTEDYRADADSRIRWEALHAIITVSSNRDADAYGRPSDYMQEITPLISFFEIQAQPVRQRYGDKAGDEMMALARECSNNMKKVQDFFAPLTEDPAIHNLRRKDFEPTYKRRDKAASGNWIGESVFHHGLWYMSSGGSGIEVRTDDNVLVARQVFPDLVWVRDIWLAGDQIYIPCRSYCHPTILVRYDKGLAARSAIGTWMDPLPVGVWRSPQVPD